MLKAKVCFSAFDKISGDTHHKRRIQTMLFLVKCLDTVAGSFVVSKLRLVLLLVKHGLVVTQSALEDVDW
jgi:hypothetical protein